MHLAVVQMEMNWTAAENVSSIVSAVKFARGLGAEAAIFPELAVTGFHRQIVEACEASRTSGWEKLISTACKEAGIGAWVGAPIYDAQKIYNAYLYFDKAGEIQSRTFKQGLTESEKQLFDPGGARSVSTQNGERTAIVVCREIVDLAQLQSDLPASPSLIVWPGYISHEPISDSEEQVTHEQAAQVAKTISANLIQSNWANSLNDPEMQTLGSSISIGSDGLPFFKCPPAEAGIAIINLNAKSGVWHPMNQASIS